MKKEERTKLEPEAFDMYILGYGDQKISDELMINRLTVTNWKNKNNWVERKAEIDKAVQEAKKDEIVNFKKGQLDTIKALMIKCMKDLKEDKVRGNIRDWLALLEKFEQMTEGSSSGDEEEKDSLLKKLAKRHNECETCQKKYGEEIMPMGNFTMVINRSMVNPRDLEDNHPKEEKELANSEVLTTEEDQARDLPVKDPSDQLSKNRFDEVEETEEEKLEREVQEAMQ